MLPSLSLNPYGEVLETYQGKTDRTVILIEDLHSVSEAQESIYQLISFFRKNRGIACVALEGASGELEVDIFRSCPNQSRLQQIIHRHLRSGDLASSVASAIFDKKQGCSYYGIEDWELYQQGLTFFLAAIREEKSILKDLDRLRHRLTLEKQRTYSPQLLELDEASEAFYRDEKSVISLLEQVRAIRELPENSPVRFLLKADQPQKSFQQSEIEVKQIAGKVKQILKDKNDPKQIAQFGKLYQAYQTSELSAVDFALLMEEDLGFERFPVEMSRRLRRLINGRKKWRDARVHSLWRGVESYIDDVFGIFIQSEAQKTLYQQSRRLRLLTEFAHLELRSEQWEDLEKNQLENLGQENEWRNHIAFYQNAVQREAVFYEKLRRIMQEKNYREILTVVGGFHIADLTKRLKKDGISYVLVLPRWGISTRISHYRDQIQGEVPWKAYFIPEGGRVNLFRSFIRFIRDHVTQGLQSQEDVLKPWGYRLFLDLCRQGRELEFFKYFGLLSSAIPPDYSGPALLSPFSFIDASRNSWGSSSPSVQREQEGVHRAEVRAGDAITETLASEVVSRILSRLKTLTTERGMVVGLDLALDAALAMALRQMKPYVGRALLLDEHAKPLRKGDSDFVAVQVTGNFSTFRFSSVPNKVLAVIRDDEKIAADVLKYPYLYGIVVRGEVPPRGRIYYDWVEKVVQLALAFMVSQHVENTEQLRNLDTLRELQNKVVEEFFLPIEMEPQRLVLDRTRFQRWILDQLLPKGKINVGGKHGDTKQLAELGKIESHHIPASNSYPVDYYNQTVGKVLHRDDKPALTLTRTHHLETVSWGASSAARDFRKKQRRYIEMGEFWEAVAMDLQNLQYITARDGEPKKYALALKQVIDYSYRIGELKSEQKLILEGLL